MAKDREEEKNGNGKLSRKDVREHYNLEALWGDAPKLLPGGKIAPAETKARVTRGN